jgi:hypothetical protein
MAGILGGFVGVGAFNTIRTAITRRKQRQKARTHPIHHVPVRSDLSD